MFIKTKLLPVLMLLSLAAWPEFSSAEQSRPFEFVVVGDTRRAHPREKLSRDLVSMDKYRPMVLKKIGDIRPDYVIHLGDMVLNGSSEDDWAETDEELSVIKESGIPFYTALGNHEYTGSKRSALEHYFAQSPNLRRQKWYSFNYKNSAFIILDSNFDELDKSEITKQLKWLERTLAAGTSSGSIKFIFVFMHHPPFTNSEQYEPSVILQKKVVNIISRFKKVKFVFASHGGSYERFNIKGQNYIVTGGGGAPSMGLRSGDGIIYKDEYGDGNLRGIHFCLVAVSDDGIKFTTRHLNLESMGWQTGDTVDVP
jgi:3',5'-cyclic AMP phosphodiesterase CpdA